MPGRLCRQVAQCRLHRVRSFRQVIVDKRRDRRDALFV